MRSSPLLLLCLLCSLVEVHSQTEYPYVYLFRQTPLPNHAYIDLSVLGYSVYAIVRCYTDLDTCCSEDQGIHRGHWIPPGSEESLLFYDDTSAGIYEFHGDRQVILHRKRGNNGYQPSGIYRCDIATNAVHNDTDNSVGESVYVGIYFYASGGNCMYDNIMTWQHGIMVYIHCSYS